VAAEYDHDVAIVGAGLLGLAAARAVAARGADFVVLEQDSIGHERAGSKGSCRIFRLGYPDPWYVSAALRARELWHALEAETSRRILLPAPHLTFGPELDGVHEAMLAAGAPCELLESDEVAERFPAVRVDGPALLETESCVTAADQALIALASAAGLVDPADPAGHSGREGARLRTGMRVSEVTDDGRRVTLRTAAGLVTARVVILATGPWTAGLLGQRVRMQVTPRLEQIAYLAPAQESGPAPIFICYGDPSPYGLPVPGSDLYKLGIHHSGPVVDPDAQPTGPDPELIARLTETAARFLPGYVPEPVATERCIYDDTSDEDFIVDRVGNVVLGCGTSGHGFKFGPLLGEWLAALALDGTAVPPDGAGPVPGARFSVSRF
jgi:sarcosine oxidase